MADFIDWPGKSGKEYRYWLNAPGTDFKDEGGNYGFAKRLQDGKFVPLYFGQADSLRSRLSSHERWPEAVRLGATHLMSHITPTGERARLAEEVDLIEEWQPALNSQHRKASS